jgi:hypothetical protein
MFAMQYRIHFDAALIGAGASTLMNGHHAAGCPVGEKNRTRYLRNCQAITLVPSFVIVR